MPVRDAIAWHQGRVVKDRGRRERNLQRQRGKAAHLIAHPAFRDSRPGRTYDVPGHVVTIAAGDVVPCRLVEVAERVLADRVYDLIVRIEIPHGDERRSRIEDHFAADSRVHVAALDTALEEYPAAPFHVMLPTGVVFERGIVHRLRSALGAGRWRVPWSRRGLPARARRGRIAAVGQHMVAGADRELRQRFSRARTLRWAGGAATSPTAATLGVLRLDRTAGGSCGPNKLAPMGVATRFCRAKAGPNL